MNTFVQTNQVRMFKGFYSSSHWLICIKDGEAQDAEVDDEDVDEDLFDENTLWGLVFLSARVSSGDFVTLNSRFPRNADGTISPLPVYLK